MAAEPAQDPTNEELEALITAGADLDDVEVDGDRGDEIVDEGAVQPEAAPEEAPAPAEGETNEEVAAENGETDDASGNEQATDEESAQPEEKPREKWIPRERFDELNERRRAAEARLRELEEQRKAAEAPTEFDFDAKEKEYMDAVLDGNEEQAMAIRREIRAAELALAQQVAASAGNAAREAALHDIRLQEAVEELQSKYEVFNPESENYDDTLTDEALTLRDTFVQQGLTPASALRKAVGYVVKAYDIPAADEAPAEPPRGLAGNESPAPSRAQIERKLEEASRQPASAPSRAREEPRIDLETMPEEEFEKLSIDALRKLRGDFA